MMKRKCISILLCLVLCVGTVPAGATASVYDTVAPAETLAADLKELGLFQGVSDTDFALYRVPTRTEALVMLIRVLGQEETALGGDWSHPFGDVPAWAAEYVGYAYQTGLTRGVSGNRFGGEASAGSAVYLTFLLRALGYSDENGLDFTWDAPYTLSRRIGLLPDGADTENFLRADVVLISYAALSCHLKNSAETLAERLMEQGVFTRTQYDAVLARHSGETVLPSAAPLSAQEIYARCSPAVFCILTYDAAGEPYAQGSGFFIRSGGLAVTNYHVLEDALSATATLTDGSVLEITGVWYFDAAADYAVIQVDGGGFPALPVGNSDGVRGGETIYAIGNPQGLTNTISDGIVSNPRRDDFNGMIQISAPISSGSSGGALINAYGQVVGVTTGTITSGQNLNFAVPINQVLSQGDVEQYASAHALLSLREYAAINGYIAGGSRSAAYSAMGQFIRQNANETISGRSSFTTRFTTEDGFTQLLRAIDTGSGNELIFSCRIQSPGGSVQYSYLYLSPETQAVYSDYSYYAPGNHQTPVFFGSGGIEPSTLSENMSYSFAEYDGPEDYVDRCAAFALEMYCMTVEYIQWLFQNQVSPIGAFRVADLGFTGFYT